MSSATRNPLHWESGPATTWTTVNTAEALPGVLTPLAWGFWEDSIELGMRQCFFDLGVLSSSEVYNPSSADERFSVVFYGRYSANINQMRMVGDRMLGTNGDAVEEQILGGLGSGIASQAEPKRYPVVVAKMPRLAFAIPKRLAAVRRETNQWWAEATSPQSFQDGAAAPRRFLDASRRFQAVMRHHAAATMLAQAAYDQVRLLTEAAGHPGLERRLVTGYGDFEEAEVAGDLWSVSRGKATIEQFTARHGYHGPNEGAVHSHSWREDAAPLMALVETYQTMPDSDDPHRAEVERSVERERAEAQLLGSLGRVGSARARAVLGFARRHVPLREIGKAAFLQTIDGGRAAARSYGSWLVTAGRLDDPEDVFYLTKSEVGEGRIDDLRELVAARRAEREEYRQLRLPDSWQGNPEPIRILDEAEDDCDEVDGLPVSPGIVEARARVITDPDGGVEIEPGEVLVCETTDPSWAAYFLVASALVIDIGGAMSHGAIVARELGVPCVINTRNGTRRIRTGDLVAIDGESGKVRVLERAA